MAGLQLSGLVSGIDTGSIITQLMAIEKAPRTKITLEPGRDDQAPEPPAGPLDQGHGAEVGQRRPQVGPQLARHADGRDRRRVARSPCSRTGGAPPGGYDVAITQLASAERQTFSFVSPAADGTLDIANADGSARTSIALKAGATLDDAVAAINGSSTSKLYAVNVNGSLVLSAKTTGDSERLRDHRRPASAPRPSASPGQNALVTDQRHARTSGRATRSPTRSPACSSRSRARPRSARPSASPSGPPGPTRT